MPTSFRSILRVASPLALAAGLSACAADALPPPPPPAPELTVRNFVVFFAFDRSDLDDAARKTIADAAAAMRSGAGARITVSGHADAAGPAAYNQGLSERRAAAVSRALIDAGVDPAAVVMAAHGESRLLRPTADGVADPRNRRVEVAFRPAARAAAASRGGPCPYGTVTGTTIFYTPAEFAAFQACMEALHGNWMGNDAGRDSAAGAASGESSGGGGGGGGGHGGGGGGGHGGGGGGGHGGGGGGGRGGR